jgi:chromate transporter
MDSRARAGDLASAGAAPCPSIRDDLRVWGRVSVAGIGGPALQIATMHRLLVKEMKWISEERFFRALGYCIAMPGPETQQLAIYVGWLSHRVIGAVSAGGLFVLPGMVCMMALSFGFVTGANSEIGQAIFFGVKPAILAIMTEAVLRFGRQVLHGKLMIALAAIAFVAAFCKVAFPIIIIVAALVGLAAAIAGAPGFGPSIFASIGKPHDRHHAETAPHLRPPLARVIFSVVLWLCLWLTPPLILLALFGPTNIFTQISLLFSKVILMAIGGDYAVIAYAAEQVTSAYHWLSAREVQEGIAMGEMVPGTIMIVTQFFGFLAAYRDPGLLPPLVAGTFGGLLAAWAIFVPCFTWIFAVAPFLDGMRKNAFLDGPLRAATAAAVGMIVNLSVWFGIRTLFHELGSVHYGSLVLDLPNVGSLDPWAVLLFAVATFAILRFKVSAVATLFASSAAGMILLVSGLTAGR